MDRNLVPKWARAMAWLSLASAPVFAGLGLAYGKPEWICGGAALTVYGIVTLRQSRRSTSPEAGT